MAKQGMKRPDYTKEGSTNEVQPVQEMQGKAKKSKAKAKPITEQ